jgi:16S rRNA processing protein RimM
MDRDAADEWMLVGRVVGPFGVHGEMKVEPYTDFPDRFSRLQHVYIGEERRAYKVLGSRRHKHVLLRLAGLTTPEEVAALHGQYVWIPRSEAMPLGEGEYYIRDIIGLRVFSTEGEQLGEVQDILITGSNDVYVVRGERGEVLIPAIHDVVRELDVPGGRIIVEVIEGMLE